MLSVALSTYNGEKYIIEQLESLSRQTLLPDELVVSDDASQDGTLACVQAFAARAPFPVRIFTHAAPAWGIVKNFSAAVGYCAGDYIALCDQDDVWLPDKLEKSMQQMRCIEAATGRGVPLLVHTDLQVMDQNLQCLHSSMMETQGITDEPDMRQAILVLLVQNYVTGCTLLFNQALKMAAWPFPHDAVMHDWWLALHAAANGRIAFVDEALLLYRQHAHNQIGAKQYISWASVKKFFSSSIREKMIRDMRQIESLAAFPQLQGAAAELVQSYLAYLKHGQWYRIHRLGVHKQKKLRNIGFYLFLFFYGKFFAKALKE